MQTFAQKQNQPKKQASSDPRRIHKAMSGVFHRADRILLFQRTIGNQAVQRLLQTDPRGLKAKSFGSASPHLGHDSSPIPIRPPAAGPTQTKLAINEPGDEFEQEADCVAEHVMRMPEPRLQRPWAGGGERPTCQTKELSQGHERLQTKHVGLDELGQTAIPPGVDEVLSSPGQSLDPAIRAFMEPRFGHDFSRVRVHSDAAGALG